MKIKINYLKITKIAIGASIAILLADQLGLRYSASAGVITLLSIQDTKKETLRVLTRRLVSFAVALVLSAVCFSLLGYGVLAVGMFLLLFSGICIHFHMQEGISVNSVLMTHFLAEQSMTAGDIRNELMLLLVGAGIGVLLNLYIPGKKKLIISSQRQIEKQMKGILGSMAEILSGQDSGHGMEVNLDKLDLELDHGERSAFEDVDNTLLSETRYYLHYMSMRKVQSLVLRRIYSDIGRLLELPPQAGVIAEFIGHISESFHEYNNAVDMMQELEAVKLGMRQQPLPVERYEFENRAVLFQILLELEQLVVMKKEFVSNLSEKEIREFW